MNNPKPGDVVFFDNTYDRNKNKRLDDSLTHIAIVVSVDTMDGSNGSFGRLWYYRLSNEPGTSDRARVTRRKNLEQLSSGNRKGETSPRMAGRLFRNYARFSDPIDAS